jgi:hypothetical protein
VAVALIAEAAAHVRLFAEFVVRDAGHETRSAATVEQANALIESDEHIEGRRSLD